MGPLNLLMALVPGLIVGLLFDVCTPISRWIARRAAKGLPDDLRSSCEEQWLADIDAIGWQVGKIWFALGLFHAGKGLIDLHNEENATAVVEEVAEAQAEVAALLGRLRDGEADVYGAVAVYQFTYVEKKLMDIQASRHLPVKITLIDEVCMLRDLGIVPPRVARRLQNLVSIRNEIVANHLHERISLAFVESYRQQCRQMIADLEEIVTPAACFGSGGIDRRRAGLYLTRAKSNLF